MERDGEHGEEVKVYKFRGRELKEDLDDSPSKRLRLGELYGVTSSPGSACRRPPCPPPPRGRSLATCPGEQGPALVRKADRSQPLPLLPCGETSHTDRWTGSVGRRDRWWTGWLSTSPGSTRLLPTDIPVHEHLPGTLDNERENEVHLPPDGECLALRLFGIQHQLPQHHPDPPSISGRGSKTGSKEGNKGNISTRKENTPTTATRTSMKQSGTLRKEEYSGRSEVKRKIEAEASSSSKPEVLSSSSQLLSKKETHLHWARQQIRPGTPPPEDAGHVCSVSSSSSSLDRTEHLPPAGLSGGNSGGRGPQTLLGRIGDIRSLSEEYSSTTAGQLSKLDTAARGEEDDCRAGTDGTGQ